MHLTRGGEIPLVLTATLQKWEPLWCPFHRRRSRFRKGPWPRSQSCLSQNLHVSDSRSASHRRRVFHHLPGSLTSIPALRSESLQLSVERRALPQHNSQQMDLLGRRNKETPPSNKPVLAVAAELVSKSCPALWDPMGCSQQAPLFMGFSRQEYWSGLSFLLHQ